jgi:hypothetical protein
VRFDIQPYTGALPITFGMGREQVHRLLGPPDSNFPIWDGSGVSEHYKEDRFNIGYTNSGNVNHLGFSPGGAELTIRGQLIWTREKQTDPNPTLLTLDPAPVEVVGFWFFLTIGVTTTGYHDDDPSQHAVTVFPLDSKQEFVATAKLADITKYCSKSR